MFEAFGFSADPPTLQKNHLSYLRARPLWWFSSLCLNSFFFSLADSSSIADLLPPGSSVVNVRTAIHSYLDQCSLVVVWVFDCDVVQ